MKVAINGFGRIGRLTLRSLLNRKDIEIVAINDLTDTYTLAHLLKYDTAHGKLKNEIKANENSLFIDSMAISVTAEKNPAKLPWNDLGVDVVLECTGRFTSKEDLEMHLQAGAKKVVLSAPAKGGVKTIVIGVNDEDITAGDNVLSNASCTTNCLAPMAKVLHQGFGIESGFMTTVHAYTSDQNIQDAPHRDLRRARAAALNIIPTSTGAAKAIDLVLPDLKGKLDGNALRVPVLNGSLTELTCILNRETSTEEIKKAFMKAAETDLLNILQYSDEPLVSSDIVGNPHSCIFDAPLVMVSGKLVKVVGWYDNEFGYSSRLADLVELIHNKG